VTNATQAPTAPKKRPSIRSKASSKPSQSGSGLISRPSTSFHSDNVAEPSFINSKKDRRTIKHSAFVSRIEKAHKKPLKRRRPNKKLVTTLEGLADALPDVEDLVNGTGTGGKGGRKGPAAKSLKSKPGAMKRKEKLERGERERFGKNLAVIMGSRVVVEENMQDAGTVQDGEATAAVKPSATAGRFAALRAWVGTNMEKHPAFEKEKE
jgi:Ribosome biogenesis protein SLX9